jgi:hypothetical protein
VCAFVNTATAQSRVITGFFNPESVVSDGTRFFVSNLGAKTEPQAKDGDGFISEVARDGTITNSKFLPQVLARSGC